VYNAKNEVFPLEYRVGLMHRYLGWIPVKEKSYCLRFQMCCRLVILLMFVDSFIIVQFIKKNPTRCNNVSKFYYSIFIRSATCFGRHTTNYQEPKTALAASGFSCAEGCLYV